MATELVMPKFGLSMTEGTIIKWLKKEGDILKKGDDVLEIETEKLTNTVPAPDDGILLKILAKEGDVIPAGIIIGYIGKPGELIPEIEEIKTDAKEGLTIPAKKEFFKGKGNTANKKIKIAPVAKALAEKMNIDYTQIKGTGPGGRIVKGDIIAFSEKQNNTLVEDHITSNANSPSDQQNEFDVISYTGMRKAIGVNMSKSWSVAPRVTHHVKADVTELMELRHTLNHNLKDGNVKLSVTGLITKIVAKALKQVPIMNSTLIGDNIKVFKNINIGIAVNLDKGLIVPVIKNADKKDVFSISKEIKKLSGKAKNNSLSENDISGSTFTISNIGSYGSVDLFSPIINQPESAILGVCRTKQEPVVINNEVVIRSLMGLSLTFDHRVIDGAPAAEFLAVIIELIKNPLRAIFEN